MANQMPHDYDRKIQFFKSCGDQLLEWIKPLEIEMNRQKQLHQPIDFTDIDWMYCLVKKFLGILAEIKACEYFKMTKILVNSNDDFYKKTCNAFYTDLVKKFNRTLNAKRLNANNQIDFSIH